MLPITHPRVKKVIHQFEHRVKKLTGNPNVSVIFTPVPNQVLSRETVMLIACNTTGISVNEVKGRNRTRLIVITRMLISLFCRKLTGSTYAEIGRLLGNRDHTSIIHNIQAITSLIETGDDQVCTLFHRVNQEIKRLDEQEKQANKA